MIYRYFVIQAIFLSLIIQPSPGPSRAQAAAIRVRIYLPVVASDQVKFAALSLPTGISDITTLLQTCPDRDPTYSRIRSDFSILIDGQPVSDIPCSEPVSALPIDQYSQPLILYQALRVAYYLTPGYGDYLPWTTLSLYNWMAAHINGVNLKSAGGPTYCCDQIAGKVYISEPLLDASTRLGLRSWPGIASTLDLLAHETRHMDGLHPHINGCNAFNYPGAPLGCDPSYDPGNLGGYGIQYWLENAWLTGYLNVGMSCAPDRGSQYANALLYNVNTLVDRFANDPPPTEAMPDQPYGGPCLSSPAS